MTYELPKQQLHPPAWLTVERLGSRTWLRDEHGKYVADMVHRDERTNGDFECDADTRELTGRMLVHRYNVHLEMLLAVKAALDLIQDPDGDHVDANRVEDLLLTMLGREADFEKGT